MSERADVEKIKLKQCEIILTHGCNLRCEFCFEKEAGYCSDDRMDYDDLKRLVDLCGEAGVKYIFFTGGEPLVYPSLIDILQYISINYPSIMPTIATNGVLLEDNELCRCLVSSGLRYVDMSIKGVDSKSWKKATGFDGLDKQLKAIRNLSSKQIDFTCSMVITMDNVVEICNMVRFAKDNGANQFSFTFFIDNIDSDEKGRDYLERHNPFVLIEMFVSQISRLNLITDAWWVEYSYPICIYTEEQLQLLNGRLAGPCQIHLGNSITINTQMELLPCDMYFGVNLGHFGKDFSTCKELEILMKSPEFQSSVNALRDLPSSKCKSCRHLERCRGGCPVLWRNYSFDELMAFKADFLGS